MSKAKKRQFDIVTIFPEMIGGYANASILGKAQEKGLISITSHDLRQWATDKHRTTDDSSYGGGPGMVMKVAPFDRAVGDLKENGAIPRPSGRGIPQGKRKTRVILTSASGKIFTQADAKRLAKFDQLIFLCGRYEGVDARVEEKISDEAFSIGEYVLTGGELPALVMIDAIARHIPGVLGKRESLVEESHTKEGLLEYPQYTKPLAYAPLPKGGSGGLPKPWKVPEVLLSGDHAKIAEWRKEHQKRFK